VLFALRCRGSWNHNTHYHRLVLSAAPRGASRALDVGCGEGGLLVELFCSIPDVVGIDADDLVLERAAEAASGVTLVHGDFLTHAFTSGSFDLIAAVASVHHMDMAAALSRIRESLRPGGVAVVVGIARPHTAIDYLFETAGAVASRAMRALFGYREVRAPTVWPPPLTYSECRMTGLEELPGAKFRRRLFFRYTLIWMKPGSVDTAE
jgi:SAM-dependent methyltransferase